MALTKYSYYLSSIWKLATQVRPAAQVVGMFLGRKEPGGLTIELAGSGARFHTRSAMDIWSVKETFLDRFYEKYGFPLKDGWTVIDIGGGIGEFTVYAARRYPGNRVYAFEPTPDSFDLLQENLRLNGIRNAQAFPEAVWSQTGNLAVDTSPEEPSQFTSHAEEAPAKANGRVTVPAVALREVFERLGIECCDLVKIDCEGAEYEILFEVPDAVLRRIRRIVMETHDGATAYNHNDLAEFLKGKGFQVETFPNPVHKQLGYLRAQAL